MQHQNYQMILMTFLSPSSFRNIFRYKYVACVLNVESSSKTIEALLNSDSWSELCARIRAVSVLGLFHTSDIIT